MANVLEIVIKAVDSASKVIAGIEANIIGSTKDIVKNFDDSSKAISAWDSVLNKSFAGVGVSAESVSKKLEELGAATSDAAKIQHELERAQADTVAAAQKLAEAQKELIRNTDPSKEAELAREVSNAQVALDRAGDSVKKYSDKLNGLNDSTEKSKGGFSNWQSAIVTANQGIDLLGRGIGIAKEVIDQTIGSTLEYSKQVRDLSTNLGISTEETSKIIQASDDYGISVGEVTSALQMAVRKGFAPNLETIAKLADEYNRIADPTERATRLTEVFGRNWTALTPMLKEGGAAIRDAADEAEKLGLVLSDKDVQAARALEIQVDNLNDHVDALKQKIGKGLIPELSHAAEGTVNLISMLDGTATSAEKTEWQIGFLNRVFGEGAPIIAGTIKKLEDYQRALDSTAMTSGEKAVRANMAQVKSLTAVSTSMSDLERGVRNQADVYGVLDAAMDKNVAKQKLMASAQKATADAINKATLIMTAGYGGNLADENKKFAESQADLKKKAADLEQQIKSFRYTSKSTALSVEELSAAHAKLAKVTEDLSTAQRKKGETDTEFSSRLADLRAQQADLNDKIAGGAGVVTTNAKELANLKQQYSDVTEEIKKNADAHDEAMKRIVLDIAMQQLATDGWTKTEIAAFTQIAKQFGMFDQKSADLANRVLGATDQLAKDQNAETFSKRLDAALKLASDKTKGTLFDLKNKFDDQSRVMAQDQGAQTFAANYSASMDIVNQSSALALASIYAVTSAAGSMPTSITTPTLPRNPDRPGGYQRGGEFVVPPNPRGGTGDYYMAAFAPGERVNVTPAGAAQGRSGQVSIGAVNITIGGTNASTANIEQAVYDGIAKVFNEARA